MVKFHKLKNGLVCILDYNAAVFSVSAAAYIKYGTRREAVCSAGAAHFIEHMLFKGTPKRAYSKFYREIDGIGAYINAATNKNYTCVYGSVQKDKHIKFMDLMCDILFNAFFKVKEFEKEKQVVAEEIKMYMDQPEEYAYDLYYENTYKSGELSIPILGTFQTVKNFKRDSIFKTYKKYYRPSNMIFSISGSFNEGKVLKFLENLPVFSPLPFVPVKSPFLPGKNIIQKDIQQSHMIMGWNVKPKDDFSLYSLVLLNMILGGEASSLLFAELREKLGLCYSVHSHITKDMKERGIVIQTAVDFDKTKKAFEAVKKTVFAKLPKSINASKLKIAKNKFKGNMLIGLERTIAKAQFYGVNFYFQNKLKTVDYVLDLIAKIMPADLKKMNDEVFNSKYSLLLLTPKDIKL